MILEKNYRYTINGKVEVLKNNVSPSNLKRAGVPVELIAAYDFANDRLQAISGLITPEDQRNEELEELQQAKFEAQRTIEEFLENQELLQFGKVDMIKVNALFDSEITDYRIEKDTGISKASIGRFRNGTSNILKMPLRTAIILTQYAIGKGL